jgi:predicted RNA-binding protein Jag
MTEKLYRYSLDVMEKLDRRSTFLERLGYKFAHKIYVKAFTELYDMSPYDRRAMDDHDRYQDEQEYNARMNKDDVL